MALALLGANPDWPADDPGLSGRVLADPGLWPDDPGYGPGSSCRGQWGLYSFRPDCAASLQDDAGTGSQIDRAWLWTIGRPETVIATLDDGPHPDDLDLAAAWRLSTGELQPPVGAPLHDANNDGVFDVRDYTTATGTETPTIDRVRAPDLLSRPDRGDTNGNGHLDPQDILRIYANGVDDDGNGYVDDISGWDFVNDDADPFDGPAAVGPAHWALARANNRVGLAGACPGCSGLPLRVSVEGVAEPVGLALALSYAADHSANVAMVAASTWGDRPELDGALSYAEAHGTLALVGRGRLPTRSLPVTWPTDRVLFVGSVGPDTPDFRTASRFDALDPCSGDVTEGALGSPGQCDDAGLGIAAGVAGLIWTATRGLPDRDRAPWPRPASPMSIRAILAGSARTTAAGIPVLDARAAVDVALDGPVPPYATIVAPEDATVFDPSRAVPIRFVAQGPSEHSEPLNWTVEAGLRTSLPNLDLIASGRFTPGESTEIRVDIPSLGWTKDPTAPPRTDDAFTLVIRLTLRGTQGTLPAAQTLQRTVYVHRDLALLPAFPIRLPAGVTGGARVIELDDRRSELVVTTQGGRIFAVTATGAVRQVAEAPLDDRRVAHGLAPALRLASTTAFREGLPSGVSAPRYQRPDRLWTTTVRGRWLRHTVAGGTPAEYETDRDEQGRERPVRRPVALAPDGTGYYVDDAQRLLAISPAGTVQPGFPVSVGPGAGPVAVGDVDDDGRLDVFVADAGSVWRVRAEGRQHPDGPFPPGWPVALGPSIGPPPWGLQVGIGPTVTLGDVTDDEEIDIIVGAPGRPVLVLDSNGHEITSTTPLDPALTGALALGPLDEPDQLWSLMSAGRWAEPGLPIERRATAHRWPNGATASAYPVSWGDVLPLEPVVIDIDGDNRPEALWPEGPDRLRALDRDGNPPAGWPKLTGDEVVGAPAAGDLDGDGRREIAVATRRGWVFIWRTSAETGDSAPWDGHRHDIRASGDLRTATGPLAIVGDGGCSCSAKPVAPNATRIEGILVVLLLTLGLIRRRESYRRAGSR